MIKDTITYEDFSKLDLRVGKIVNAIKLESSDKLLSLTVDLGPDYGERNILAGVAQYHKPEELTGKKMIFLANIEYRKMAGSESQGMMIAANDNDKPAIILVDDSVPVGSYLL